MRQAANTKHQTLNLNAIKGGPDGWRKDSETLNLKPYTPDI